MAKLRVYQLASQYDIPSREFVQILNRFEIPVKNHMSALTDQQVKNFKNQFNPEKDRRTEEQTPAKKKKAPSKTPPAAKEETKTASQKTKQVPKQKTKQSHVDHSEKAQGTDKKRAEKKKTADVKQKSINPKQSGAQEHASGSKKKNSAEASPKQNNENKKSRKKKNKKDRVNRRNEPVLKVKDHSKKGKTSHAVYKKKKDEKKTEQAKNKVYAIPENITVSELAETLDVAATEIIKILMLAGTMATINQRIDFDTAQLVCDELGYEVEVVKVEDVFEKMLEEYDEEETGNEEIRPPVVTVMGHVDHGKTSLLDRIRKSHVTAGEAGGITQHIGAYTVKIQGKSITFIDTPGHAAFTAMRSRGAQMTDIAVLVVAADDGVMPQTIEAINHAKAAKVPIIVAINKIDKEGANSERVKQELVDQGVIIEEWGGDVIAVPVSAKKGENIDELLENILLVAEMEELKADPDRPARGCVIEARVKKGKGSTASILVQQGTLHLGDAILSGTTYGRVRTMVDDKGRRIKKAGPSRPVEISGLSGTPEAGDDFIVMPSDKEARQMAEQRLEQEKNNRQAKAKVSLDDLFSRIQEGDVKDINLIVKADVQGSVEALSQSLQKLSNDEVKVNVIHGAVGAVNESDVLLATTSDAIIIGFNVRPDKNALAAAENEKIDIHLYRVIYDAIDDVKKAMEGLLDPEFLEKVTGDAEVRSTFRIPGGIIIAGAYVTDGKISRSDEVRVARDGIVVFEGKIASLRRFKDDVKEVNQGYECGIGIENYNDIKEGDVIETFVNEAVKREL
ncbi:translation initiation factor IF-2 [Pseudoramibacter faecis]|uniref:translation initiation factor IF-2 n=1 Tax=Pseudoramibacter faecis TaxID=3108534 RepID=UPI002E75E42A|nr:translation initiation factor IF-2 [Pseudoramibacter sp. HA2172]